MTSSVGSVRAGLRLLSILLIVILSIEVLTVLTHLITGQVRVNELVRLGLTCWLCWSVYSGKGWARAVLAVLLLISGMMLLISGVLIGTGPSTIGLILVLIGALQLASGAGLFLLPQVRQYFVRGRQALKTLEP